MTGVSFLLTVYNKASYLPAVLTAVRGQTGDFSREIVIVDDGSTDESLAVARCVTEGWPDVRIVAQANAGASAAICIGGANCATAPLPERPARQSIAITRAATRICVAAGI